MNEEKTKESNCIAYYGKILLTGGSGNLGSEILKSGNFQNVLAPSHNEMDITNKDSVKNYFQNNKFDSIIHCAALVNQKECEENPIMAINTNIIGTYNLVDEVLRSKHNIHFIYISTDAVYDRGEKSSKEVILGDKGSTQVNVYEWTKLGAECVVNTLKNYCIIRTSFFNPKKIDFLEAPVDVFTSKIPINDLIDAIKLLLELKYMGTINVGNERISNYDLYKKYVSDLKPVKLDDIRHSLSFELPRDSSMNVSLWKKIKEKI